jgi:hypothetical protein
MEILPRAYLLAFSYLLLPLTEYNPHHSNNSNSIGIAIEWYPCQLLGVRVYRHLTLIALSDNFVCSEVPAAPQKLTEQA